MWDNGNPNKTVSVGRWPHAELWDLSWRQEGKKRSAMAVLEVPQAAQGSSRSDGPEDTACKCGLDTAFFKLVEIYKLSISLPYALPLW